MKGLAAYRLSTVVLAIVAVGLGVTLWVVTHASRADGNPSGLDVFGQQGVTAYLDGNLSGNMSCLTESGKWCSNLSVELHFLQDPPPTCPSPVTSSQYCTPAPGATRTLRQCQHDEVCLSINTRQPVAQPSPFKEYSQDPEDGLHDGENVGAQFIIVMKPNPSQPKKGP
jgi:hypothetical protein